MKSKTASSPSHDTKLFGEFPSVAAHEWQQRIEKDLKGQDYERALVWRLAEDLKVLPYYRREDIEGLSHIDLLSANTALRKKQRGAKGWEIRQEVYVNDIAKANAKAQQLLEYGADGIAFVLSDAMAASILSHSEQMQRLLYGLDLKEHRVHFFSGLASPQLIKALPEGLERLGLAKQDFYSCLDHDFFSHWLRQGSLPYSLEDAFDELSAMLHICQEELPQVRSLCVSGGLYHQAGADPLKEAALVLATAHDILVNLQPRIAIEALLQSLWFRLGISTEYFLEISRLRALRLLWPHILEQYHPEHKGLFIQPHIHGQSMLFNKTIFDPHNNILRSSTECMAAVLGGIDSFSCLPFDRSCQGTRDASQNGSRENFQEAPLEQSHLGERLAVRTQILHRYESYLDNVADPAAGSYYIEKLTDIAAQKIWEHFQEIEKNGGLIKMIQNGTLQKQLIEEGQKKQEQAATRTISILGVNHFPPDEQGKMLRKISKEILDGVNTAKGQPKTVKSETLAKKDQNGSQCFEPTQTLPEIRLAQGFESLRLATEKHEQAGKGVPEVRLFAFGDLAMRKARSSFARNFFGCVGYQIREESLSKDTEGCIRHILKTQAQNALGQIIVACSADEDYSTVAPLIQNEIEKQNASSLFVLAANPKKMSIEGRVFGYIYQGMNVLSELARYQKHFGIQI